jgi:hypothetical protein
VGDVLTAMNGSDLKASRIQDAEVLKRRIENMSVGESAKLTVVREGKPTELAVLLEETPNTASEAKTSSDPDLEYRSAPSCSSTASRTAGRRTRRASS